MEDTAPGPQDKISLIDGSGYIFRAYHALPPLTRADGTPVGAVLGFCNMLSRLLATLEGGRVAVILDAARQNFRNEIYPDYKANRDATPEDLIPQFPLIRRAAQAFGLPVVEQEGYEADDLIAAYAKKALESGFKANIIGSDKDLYQLIRPGVTLYDPMKDAEIGPEQVVEKFGVPPDKVIDVQSLAGDSTDNIPGVPGIGLKTAAQLITEYGSLDSLLERAGEIKQPKRREALTVHAPAARLSRRLVTLDAQAPLPIPLNALKRQDDPAALTAFLQEMGFKTLLARLGKNGRAEQTGENPNTTGSQGTASPSQTAETKKAFSPPKQNKYTLITDAETLRQWAADAQARGSIAIDTETTGLTPARATLVGISLCSRLGEAAYIPVGHEKEASLLEPTGSTALSPLNQLPLNEVLGILKKMLEDRSVLKIGHNIKFDLQMLSAHDINVSPIDDTMLLSYVMDGAAHGHGMDELAERLCGHQTITYEAVTGTGKNRIGFAQVPLDRARDYAAEDAEITFRLHAILKPRLAREHMAQVYEDIERPLIPVLAAMERTGIRIDPGVLRALSHDFSTRMAALELQIHALAGRPFNIGSPQQIGTVLFEELGLPGGGKTRTGAWSTAAGVLEDLADQGHEIVTKILEWRQLSKLRSTYTDTLLDDINPATGRVHTSFAMALTNTGRLSSSNPNLQNIPIRSEDGRKIRAAFVADPGWTILSVDYSQVELRLAAAMAGVEALKQAFRNKEDIHALTAAQVLGVPLDAVTPDQRRQAKAINFGIIYGISGYGLARQIGCTPAEANSFIKHYLSRFPELAAFMEAARAEARRDGFVRTLYGRKCVIPGIRSKNQAERAFAERQAINAPLQGTAADIMKISMGRIPSALAKAGLQGRMLLQVHDELVFEVPDAECEATAALVRSVMEQAACLDIPLVAEAGWGANWALAH